MTRFRRNEEGEKGATLIEFALIFMLLLMLALGSFEYGMALRDWLSVTIATREGARVAASAANYNAADCVILEATSGALQSFRSGRIEYVHIYRSDGTGSYPGNAALVNVYRPWGAAPDVPIPECPFWTVEAIGGSWNPADRVQSATADPYWIGVRLEYSHDWYTGFLWWNGSVDWQDNSVFKIEPRPPA
jgi:Flp pilus assembly pilin Flp